MCQLMWMMIRVVVLIFSKFGETPLTPIRFQHCHNMSSSPSMSLNVFEAFKTKQAPKHRGLVCHNPQLLRGLDIWFAATWGLARRCGWGSLVDDFPSTGMTCILPLFQLSFRGCTCMLEGISMSKRWCKLHSLCASFLRLSECHLSCLRWAECFSLSGIPANLYFFHLVQETVQSLCDLQCLQHPLPWKSSWKNMKIVCLHFAYAAKCNKDAYRSRNKTHLVKGTADLGSEKSISRSNISSIFQLMLPIPSVTLVVDSLGLGNSSTWRKENIHHPFTQA